MSLCGHYLSLIALTLILIQNCLQICETKANESSDDNLDLTYSDSSHGPQTAAAHQQIVYIDHGGGAISHIRRTSFFPNPSLASVPSLPYRPHVEHYPNSVFENNLAEDPYVNFPEDIPRIIERRTGPNPDPNQIGLQSPPQNVAFIPQNIPQHQNNIPITPELHQPIHPQQAPPVPHHPELHQLTHPFPHHLPQPIPQPFPYPHHIPQHIPQSLSHPNVQQIGHLIPHQIHQPIQLPVHQPIPQPIDQPQPQPFSPPNTHSISTPYRHPIDDIEDERFLINNEIERIPKPSNQIKPAQREPPTPPPTPIQDPPINSFFDFNSPEIFGGIDSPIDAPFDPFGGQINPLFQRRRLTTNNNNNLNNNNNNKNNNNNNNNNNAQDVNQNSIGYPPYAYYKGEDSPPATNWPKIFKFSDGRFNLYDFEKQKKQNKIKFTSKETYFDHISRDSFLILHGGTFAQ